MLTLYNQLRSLAKDEKGQTVIEYGLIALLVAVATIGSYRALGSGVQGALDTIVTALTST
jgi:Flp pilus assembly pilin Flp